MSNAFSDADAQTFVESYAAYPLKGTSGQTLQNYVNTHVPSWGVVVNPFPDVDVLVWYDYTGKLHVIEQIPADVAVQIAKPAYHTADESFLYNLAQQTAALGKSAFDWTTYALIGAALLALIVYSPQIKSAFK
jgi:hypothetical protein